MKALIQRVTAASIAVSDQKIAQIGKGMVVLLGVVKGDAEQNADDLARKTLDLRIFADENHRMNRSAIDIGADVLVVSQFTLAANTRKGNRPNFGDAANPEIAEKLYLRFAATIKDQLGKVATGHFGAYMRVHLENDGPVTILLER